jgi:DNA recombination protein RmuC
VKTRGILGEIQLGAILEGILSPEQYQSNVATVPGSQNRVEFAVLLPGDGEVKVFLPIDSKFPADAYVSLQDAYDSADPELVKAQKAQLESRIKSFAKDIHTKYISPPHTTDFAIMFLPTEGLYAEVVKMGMVEILQKNYKINIAGPTTMAALLNSLQTGFRTLAIQKRSSEVWEVLGAVRTEFDKFESALRDAQAKLEQANRGLDTLVGVRTRQIQRKLKGVSALPTQKAMAILDEENHAEE